MFKLFSLVILASLLFPCPAFCERQGDKPATSTDWQQLGLSSTTIAGVTVHYEKCLEPNLPIFESQYNKFLAEREKFNHILANAQEIISDINRILGVADPNMEKQSKLFMAFAKGFSQAKPTFYLVTRPTIKNFMRAGGQLPDCTYDKASDMVSYTPGWRGTSTTAPLKEFEFATPIAPDKNFADQVTEIFHVLNESFAGAALLGVAIHEVAEMTLISRAKPTDGYWRWFSDGFANAVTIEILKRHVGGKAADDFSALFDTNKYKDLEREMNLRYWLAAHCCILPKEALLEAEDKVDSARYAYATFEARRLIVAHGIDCVRKILDEASAKQSRNSSDLLEAVKNVTGEDMDARLSTYQSFRQREEGVKNYATLFNAASEKKDYEQMLVNLFRLHELRAPDEAQQLLYDYCHAATLLLKLGHEQAADKAMANCIEFFSNPGFTHGREVALEAFVAYALDSGKPRKAQKAAEELLKTAPQSIPALTVQMAVDLDDKHLAEAQELAKKIISLSKNEQSRPHKLALKVLAIDPNQLPPQR